MVLDAAYAAQFLAAAGASGAAVHQGGERGSVAGRLLGVVPVEHQDTPVPGGGAQDDLAGHVLVVGDQGTDQAAPAQRGQLDGLGHRVVGDDGGHRAEGLDLVRLSRTRLGAQQDRRHERARPVVGPDDLDPIGVAEHDLGGAPQSPDRLAYRLALFEGDQRAHPAVGMVGRPDPDLGQAVGESLDDGVGHTGGHEYSTDGGALLARLHGHLSDDLLHVQVELGVLDPHVRPEHREVEGVGLHVELDAAADHVRVFA